MSESEPIHLPEHVIHHSITWLLLQGAVAWMVFAATAILISWLPAVMTWYNQANRRGINVSIEAVYTWLPWLHTGLNILYGWLMLYIVLSWILEYYIVRKDTLFIRSGIIFSRESTYEIEDIKTIEVKQHFLDKLLKTGDIKATAFRAQTTILLHHIEHPKEIATHIEHLRSRIEAQKDNGTNLYTNK